MLTRLVPGSCLSIVRIPKSPPGGAGRVRPTVFVMPGFMHLHLCLRDCGPEGGEGGVCFSPQGAVGVPKYKCAVQGLL